MEIIKKPEFLTDWHKFRSTKLHTKMIKERLKYEKEKSGTKVTESSYLRYLIEKDHEEVFGKNHKCK